MDAVRALREAIWANGFRPVAVQTAKKGDKKTGKAPVSPKWQIGARRDPPEVIEIANAVAWAANTGIMCDGLRAIDDDIDDPVMAAAVSALAFDMLGATILRVRDNSPRCLMVYRAATGEPVKLFLEGATHSDTVSCRIEVLGLGQQFVAHGNHWTGAELRWPGGGPANTTCDSLPEVTEEQINNFLAACVPIIGAKPIPVKPPRKKPDADKKQTGDLFEGTFFDRVNALALADLEAWVPTLFPTAVLQQGTDAWRVKSKDRGRPDLEEDISFHPDGIQDFGEEKGLTPIDAVIAFSEAKTVTSAALWLCGQLQTDPEPLGWSKFKSPEPAGPNAPVIEGDPPIELPVDKPPEDGPPGGDPPPGDPPGEPDPKLPEEIPTVIYEDGEIVRMVREAEAHLFAAPHLSVYQRGSLVQPYQNEYLDANGNVTHSAGLVTMTPSALMKLLASSANYIKWVQSANKGLGAYKKIRPPDKLVETVLYDRVDWPFDTVKGVLSCPTMRPDGSLLTTPGYDAATRYFLMTPSTLVVPEIPDKPSKNDARAALIRLLGLLESYPFVNAPSKAVALCILMTQVLRCAMPISPMLAVSAKAPGTGKSHLVDLGATVAIGRPCPSMGAGKDEKETEKEINTMLLSGVPGFSIDNVSRDVESDLLNRATSQTHLMIRIFGKLEQIEVENSVVVYMTGNNLAVINEQRRRTVRCEMDAGLENPERRDFDGDPINIVLADRGRFVADVLTIARAYHVSGATTCPYPFNGFAAWSHFVREPLIWLGQADACDTVDMTEKDDPVTMRLHAMVEGWWNCLGAVPTTAAAAVSRANLEADQNGFYDVLKEQFPVKGGAGVDTTRLGHWLRKFSGRVSNGKRFIRDDGATGGSVRWKIEYA
jgi:putative DNA primase/helicase